MSVVQTADELTLIQGSDSFNLKSVENNILEGIFEISDLN